MIIETTLAFDDFSEDALEDFIGQAIGKPFYNTDDVAIGIIMDARRIEDFKHIKFEVLLWN